MAVIIQIVGISIVIFIVDFLFIPSNNGSLLMGLLFWAAVGQGIIAITAASDLARGEWGNEIRPQLLNYYPLLILFPVVFLIFSHDITIYSWTEHPSGWLNPMFFIIRNTFLLLLPFICAHFYAKSVWQGSTKKGFWAVTYLLIFVASQSFMAFDIIMTFEYPWFSDLFGGYLFIESIYTGTAFTAILTGILARRCDNKYRRPYNNFTLLMMAFALLWAGLFYAQYLTIWYGNLPEEVSFIAKRMQKPILRIMGIYMLLTMFLIPFCSLLSRRVKFYVPAVITIALLVFSGLFVERLIFLLPVANLSFVGVLLSLVLVGIPYIYLFLKQTVYCKG